MAKYNVGDRFITTITDIDDTGMGTIYTLDHALYANDLQLSEMEVESLAPFEAAEDKPKEYTAEELKERIFKIIDVLNRVTEEYRRVQGTLNLAVPNADADIDRLSL